VTDGPRNASGALLGAVSAAQEILGEVAARVARRDEHPMLTPDGVDVEAAFRVGEVIDMLADARERVVAEHRVVFVFLRVEASPDDPRTADVIGDLVTKAAAAADVQLHVTCPQVKEIED